MQKIMVTIVVLVMAVFMGFITVNHCYAAGGTADEAQALVEKAMNCIAAEGKDKAFAEFSNSAGAFVDRDLYIFVVDLNGITLAHGGNAQLVGRDMSRLRDADGVYFIQNFIEMAKEQGRGWVDYKWVNPTTKKIEHKSTYIQRRDDYFLGCGIYKQ